jgi:hypothetical protein
MLLKLQAKKQYCSVELLQSCDTVLKKEYVTYMNMADVLYWDILVCTLTVVDTVFMGSRKRKANGIEIKTSFKYTWEKYAFFMHISRCWEKWYCRIH